MSDSAATMMAKLSARARGAADARTPDGKFSKGGVSWTSPARGVPARVLPVVPLYGDTFALIRDASVVCGGEMTGGKFCARKTGSLQCKNHHQGALSLKSRTIYVRAATSGSSLTSVFQEPSLSVEGMEEDLVEYLAQSSEADGPLSSRSLFNFVLDNDLKTTASFSEAVDCFDNGNKNLLAKTPGKRKQEKEELKKKEDEEGLPDISSLYLTNVSAIDDGAIGSEDVGGFAGMLDSLTDVLGLQGAAEQHRKLVRDMGERIDLLSATGVQGAVLLRLVEEDLAKEKEQWEDYLLALRSRVGALEADVGSRVAGSDLPLTLWDSVLGLLVEVRGCVHTSEFDSTLRDITEVITKLAKEVEVISLGGRGAQTEDENAAVRVSGTPASYDIANVVRLEVSGLSGAWTEELDKVRLALEELKGKVFGNGGGGGGLDCGKDTIHGPEDAGAVLEKAQLAAIPVACFVTPHVLMEITYRCLFDLMQPGERDAVSLQSLGMSSLDFWSGSAMQRAIPKLFSVGTAVPGMTYSAVVRARFPAIPTRKVFGRDTDDESVYKRILQALESATSTLSNHIDDSLGQYAAEDLCRLCHRMLLKSKRFIEEMFKYMDVTCRELEVAFQSETEAWDLVCYCVREIFSTEFKAARDLASGANVKERAGGARFLYSGIRVMLKAEDFLSVGVRNHPALTAAMVRFVMVMGKKGGGGNLEAEVRSLKETVAALKQQLTAMTGDVDTLKTKSTYFQKMIDKFKTIATTKGWVFKKD
jgi:hypothetical protein